MHLMPHYSIRSSPVPALEKTNLVDVQGLPPNGDYRNADACAQVLGCSILLTPPEPICALWGISSKLCTEAEAPRQQHVKSREGRQLLEGQDAHGLAQVGSDCALWLAHNFHLFMAAKPLRNRRNSEL